MVLEFQRTLLRQVYLDSILFFFHLLRIAFNCTQLNDRSSLFVSYVRIVLSESLYRLLCTEYAMWENTLPFSLNLNGRVWTRLRFGTCTEQLSRSWGYEKQQLASLQRVRTTSKTSSSLENVGFDAASMKNDAGMHMQCWYATVYFYFYFISRCFFITLGLRTVGVRIFLGVPAGGLKQVQAAWVSTFWRVHSLQNRPLNTLVVVFFPKHLFWHIWHTTTVLMSWR